jgi:hypothetical protein
VYYSFKRMSHSSAVVLGSDKADIIFGSQLHVDVIVVRIKFPSRLRCNVKILMCKLRKINLAQ